MEIRYTRNDGYWALNEYRLNTSGEVYATTKTLDTTGGKVGEYPDWLKKIVDVALVGGHLKSLDQGPPHAILWFRVDKDLNLLEITFP